VLRLVLPLGQKWPDLDVEYCEKSTLPVCQRSVKTKAGKHEASHQQFRYLLLMVSHGSSWDTPNAVCMSLG
jgi:hypothetical protein